MNSSVFVAWDGDQIGRAIGVATLHDRPEELAKLSNAIDRGNEVFRSWTLRVAGSVVQIGGDEGRVQVPPDALVELPQLMTQYETAVGATVSVGVGARLSEAAKALWVAKLRGGNKILMYSPDMEQEIAQAQSKEADKLKSEYGGGLQKFEEQPVQQPAPAADGGQVSQVTLADEVRMAARKQLRMRKQLEAQRATDADQVRAQVAKILQKLHGQVPDLQARAPGAVAALSELIAGIRDLARQLPARALQKAEQLEKAVAANDLAGIAKMTTHEGHQLVDHRPHLTAHPPHIQHEVDAYQQHVLASPDVARKVSAKKSGLAHGISRKVVYHAQPEGAEKPVKYMVKPYHEKVASRTKGWQKYPIQGWAEMTNQSLYHAAGLGHLHQKVHTAEHNMGPGHEQEPALVVHLTPDHITAADRTLPVADEAKDQARKIAFMDFLTNNLDRHHGNLLVHHSGKSVMAIDHSRSFQYVNTHPDKMSGVTAAQRLKGGRYLNDTVGDYVQYQYKANLPMAFEKYRQNTAVGKFAPLWEKTNDPSNYTATRDAMHNGKLQWADSFNDWWGEVGPKVRKALDEHLPHIQDPKVREHIRRNFHARADHLDMMARDGLENYGDDWFRQEVPMYRPGELTDHEREEARIKALREEAA